MPIHYTGSNNYYAFCGKNIMYFAIGKGKEDICTQHDYLDKCTRRGFIIYLKQKGWEVEEDGEGCTCPNCSWERIT